jgi:protein-tyrosine phosphatase
MIDLHSHVLPAVDDGPATLDESLDMLAIGAADGIRTVVSTPHHDGEAIVAPPRVVVQLARLRRAVRECRLPVQVVAGFEVALTPALGEAGAAARVLGLNGSRYLLVEPPVLWSPFVHEVLFALQNGGLRPIVAHAERYAIALQTPEAIAELVNWGALLQVNADSLLAGRGSRRQHAARALLTRGLVSFLASDAHSSQRRPPRLRAAVEAAGRLIGDAAAEALVTTNPAAVLADADLPPPPPQPARRWRLFPGRPL